MLELVQDGHRIIPQLDTVHKVNLTIKTQDPGARLPPALACRRPATSPDWWRTCQAQDSGPAARGGRGQILVSLSTPSEIIFQDFQDCVVDLINQWNCIENLVTNP